MLTDDLAAGHAVHQVRKPRYQLREEGKQNKQDDDGRNKGNGFFGVGFHGAVQDRTKNKTS